MRTTWVLTEEERKQKFEGRTKRKSCSDNNEELSEEELVAIGGYVKASDYWDQSNDLDTSLLRQIIRMVAFGARITMEGQVANKVLTRLCIIELVKRQYKDKKTSGAIAGGDDGEDDRLCHQHPGVPAVVQDRPGRTPQEQPQHCDEERNSHGKLEKENQDLIIDRMKICSFFNPAFSWVDQLAPLLGAGEVDKLNAKLRSLNVTGAQCHNVNSG